MAFFQILPFFNLLLSEELLYGSGVFITIASCLKKKHLDVIEYVLNFCSWSAPSFLGGRLWDVVWRRKILLLGTVNLKQYKGRNFSVIMLISRWEVRRETCFYLLFEIIKQLFQRDEVSCTKFTIYLCLSCKNISRLLNWKTFYSSWTIKSLCCNVFDFCRADIQVVE